MGETGTEAVETLEIMEDSDRGCAYLAADNPGTVPLTPGPDKTAPSKEERVNGGMSATPVVASPVLEIHKLRSYPKVFSIGHRAVKQLFEELVLIEEKVDGSQFSMSVGTDGILRCRSHKKEVDVEAPDKMFVLAVQTAKELADKLRPGWTYRCEYLRKPKHNTLAYDRVPLKHLVLLDVDTGMEAYLSCSEKMDEAERIGLEAVPWLFYGRVKSQEELLALLKEDSFLGGQKVEGIVAKNYARFGVDGHVLMGKYVSEEFKEIHQKSWKDRHPGGRDILQRLVNGLKTEARWNKAVQYLRDRGELTGSPKDIGPLIAEVKTDTMDECADEMRNQLYAWARDAVARGVAAGFAEWYKKKLLEGQFEE